MDILKIAQRVDAVVGILFLAAAAFFAYKHSYAWAGVLLLSSVLSLLSAKYTPAKWVLKRMLLARMK